jgi:glucokinase
VKRAILVNGLPASGKSTVARAISHTRDWPLLTLDTVKEAFFAHLGTGDREYNRQLGKASYRAIFALAGDFPDGATVVVDAWFGFQPLDVLQDHLARAGINQAAEIWCHAPGEVLGERYRARIEQRHSGHLGASYIPELVELAKRAQPLGKFPLFEVDTTRPLDMAALAAWLNAELGPRKSA